VIRPEPHPVLLVSCRFYERIAVGPDQFRYQAFTISGSPSRDGRLLTAHAPAVGDVISLYDDLRKAGGAYLVTDRAWLHSSLGSANWPYLEPLPVEGPGLDIIVEVMTGESAPFRGQVTDEEG
jgi:hypothetical protein